MCIKCILIALLFVGNMYPKWQKLKHMYIRCNFSIHSYAIWIQTFIQSDTDLWLPYDHKRRMREPQACTYQMQFDKLITLLFIANIYPKWHQFMTSSWPSKLCILNLYQLVEYCYLRPAFLLKWGQFTTSWIWPSIFGKFRTMIAQLLVKKQSATDIPVWWHQNLAQDIVSKMCAWIIEMVPKVAPTKDWFYFSGALGIGY